MPDSSQPTASQPLDLNTPRRIHIVGVGGSGMSAIAEILVGTGHQVSGSDLVASAPLERLKAAGNTTYVGHDAAHLGDAEVVAISTAIPATNPEVVAAKASGIPVLSRAEVLTAITRSWTTLSVAGTHGKTTTSAMLTVALRGAGLDPAFIVGGDLRDLGTGAQVGGGELLVVEADESDGTFVELESTGVIVTNVEPDHLEHYGTFENLEATFRRFVAQPSGPKVICIDDPGAARLAATLPLTELTSYGTKPGANWRIVDPLPTPVGISFALEHRDHPTVRVSLRQPGMHNARNATAAIAMAVAMGASVEAAAAALNEFGGVGRRFEVRGEVAGITLVDDYAHLPTEVGSALAAAKSLKPNRLVAVFQPHRYSRTEQLWSTFRDAFVDADLLIVTGIYAAGEKPRPGVSGELIANDVAAANADIDIRYIDSLADVVSFLADELTTGDLCMTLGAGDLTRIPDDVVRRLETRFADRD